MIAGTVTVSTAISLAAYVPEGTRRARLRVQLQGTAAGNDVQFRAQKTGGALGVNTEVAAVDDANGAPICKDFWVDLDANREFIAKFQLSFTPVVRLLYLLCYELGPET
jgi:hypothetical protein